MPAATFEAFKAELCALREILLNVPNKILRDEELRDRFRTLFRTWRLTVRPSVEPLLQSKREFLKLEAELEASARLTSKLKPVTDYRKRINRAITLANNLVLYLPPPKKQKSLAIPPSDLFLSSIPDLPSVFVPNSLFGWRSKIESFVKQYSFDKSVFIMIRYRKKNENLIKEIKSVLSDNGHNGILASEHNLTNDLYNPIACLLSSSKGIAVFDQAEVSEKFNPNVAYELGMLHLLGRECLILKHKSLKTLHTDIIMKLYREYENNRRIRRHVQDWINQF